MSALPPLGASPTAEQRIAEELHELESLAAALLTARNALRDKAKSLYTSAQVGDYQASEAELVSAPLRRRIAELEQDNLRYRKAHVCTARCTSNAHVAFEGNQLVKELEEQNADLRQQIEELKTAPPAECVSVGRLTRQLDVAMSQVSALQRRKEELHIRVADLAERLDDKDKALTLAQTSREYNRENLLAARTEVERLDALAASRETALAERTAELDRTRALLRSITAERDAQQGAKQDAWERLGTIERIVRGPAVDDALNTHAIPQYAQTMANTIRAVRERLKGFS